MVYFTLVYYDVTRHVLDGCVHVGVAVCAEVVGVKKVVVSKLSFCVFGIKLKLTA